MTVLSAQDSLLLANDSGMIAIDRYVVYLCLPPDEFSQTYRAALLKGVYTANEIQYKVRAGVYLYLSY